MGNTLVGTLPSRACGAGGNSAVGSLQLRSGWEHCHRELAGGGGGGRGEVADKKSNNPSPDRWRKTQKLLMQLTFCYFSQAAALRLFRRRHEEPGDLGVGGALRREARGSKRWKQHVELLGIGEKN